MTYLEKWQNEIPIGPNLRSFLCWSTASNQPPPVTEEQAFEFEAALIELFSRVDAAEEMDLFLNLSEELVLMRLPRAVLAWHDLHRQLPWQTVPQALLQQGSAAMLSNDLDFAEDSFKKCQALAPDEIAAYVNLTQILYHQHRDAEARDWCAAGLKLDKNNATLWEIYAAMVKQDASSDQQCGETLLAEARRRDAWAGLSLAALYIDQNDPLYRAELLEDEYKAGQRDQAFLIELTAALGEAAQYEKIPPIVWQAKNLSPDKELTWQLAAHAGQAEMGMEQSEKALSWFETALRSGEVPAGTAQQLEELCQEIRSEVQPT